MSKEELKGSRKISWQLSNLPDKKLTGWKSTFDCFSTITNLVFFQMTVLLLSSFVLISKISFAEILIS